MLLSTLIVLGVFVLFLVALVFLLNPPNPYLVLIGSIILLMITFSILLDGIEIKTGSITTIVGSTTSNQTITLSNHTKIIINATSTEVVADTYRNLNRGDLRFNGIWLSVLLLTLYLAYYSIGVILDNTYGRKPEEE